MSNEAPKHFRQFIKDRYIHHLQSSGSLLTSTARRGDVKAGEVVFPIMPKKTGNVVKITGALNDVKRVQTGVDSVTVDLEDYETLPEWIFTPDLEKLTPNLKEAHAESMGWSVGRKRDDIQIRAIDAMCDASNTIGDGTLAINTRNLSRAKAEIIGTGGVYMNKLFCMIPAMWMEQLKQEEHFANADYNGPSDLPFAKMGTEKRSWDGVHYMVAPDDYFDEPAADQQHAWMWHMDCVGVENNYGDITTAEQVKTMEGNPWMLKIGFGAAAVGILKQGVKRFHMKKLVEPEEVAQLTKTA